MLLIVIVYVSVSIGGLKYGVVNSVKLIMLMLSSVGVNVGIEKWFYVFRIVFISDVREISKIQGKVIFSSWLVRVNLLVVLVKFGVVIMIIYGVVSMLVIVIIVSVSVSRLEI